jgi:hypothetical protein
MDQMLGLVAAFGLGVCLCAWIAHRLAVRLGVHWESTLVYFGVLDDRAPDRRRRPARRR